MAATRTGPPSPPPRPRRDTTAAPAGSRTGPVPAPSRSPRSAGALAALTATADPEGLVSVDLRTLAAELDLTTVAARALLVTLVDEGALCDLGRRVYALAGSRGTALADPAGLPGPRTPPHDAVHEGTGSPLLW